MANRKCDGCLGEDDTTKLGLSCGHQIHIGMAERAHQISNLSPFFQVGKDFSCARTLQQERPFTIHEENPRNRLMCPACSTVLTDMECAKLLDRTSYLTYGMQRQASEVIRRAVTDLALAWSPAHARDFEVKKEAATVASLETKTEGAKIDSKMRGLDKIKNLIAFYKENPNPKMGDILTEAVFEANLRDSEQELALDLINKLMEGEDDESKEKKLRVGGGAGVGYGGDETIVLSTAEKDRAKLRAKQQEIDEKVLAALKQLADVLRVDARFFGAATEALLRKEWGVLSALAEHLRNGSLQDIVVRHKVYLAVMDVCDQLAVIPMLVPLLLSSRPLRDHIIKWSPEAAVALAKTRSANAPPSSAPASARERGEVEGPPLVDSLTALSSMFDGSTDPLEAMLGKRFQACLELTERTRKLHPQFENGNNQAQILQDAIRICSLPDATHAELNHAYKSVMNKYAFRTKNFAAENIFHHFLNSEKGAGSASSASASSSNKERVVAIKNTLANLKSSCPIEWYTSIFCLVDETRYDVLSVMITGPDGTPYQNGCFFFDLRLPSTFPSDPPKAIFLTTGGGKVRFNPNLYADGKICLSLLGTWAGPKWNSKESTVLQVLLSIQSLILCTDPYFNEPGYETTKGTQAGDDRASRYNLDIRLQTLRLAVLEAMEKPPVGFADVVKDHFQLKAHAILKQCEEWRKDFTSALHLESFDKLVAQIKHKFSDDSATSALPVGQLRELGLNEAGIASGSGSNGNAPPDVAMKT